MNMSQCWWDCAWAQSAAPAWTAGIHFKSSIQRQPDNCAAWQVGLLSVNTPGIATYCTHKSVSGEILS